MEEVQTNSKNAVIFTIKSTLKCFVVYGGGGVDVPAEVMEQVEFALQQLRGPVPVKSGVEVKPRKVWLARKMIVLIPFKTH